MGGPMTVKPRVDPYSKVVLTDGNLGLGGMDYGNPGYEFNIPVTNSPSLIPQSSPDSQGLANLNISDVTTLGARTMTSSRTTSRPVSTSPRPPLTGRPIRGIAEMLRMTRPLYTYQDRWSGSSPQYQLRTSVQTSRNFRTDFRCSGTSGNQARRVPAVRLRTTRPNCIYLTNR